MGLEGKVRGGVFALLLFFSSFFGVLAFGGSLLPVFFLSPAQYRRLFDQCIGSWMTYCAALLEYLLGILPVISGDKVQRGEGCLLLMNHRTRLDWLYLWQLLVRQSGVRTEKIILKSPLKQIPGAGWAMQTGAFMFLSRKWENDKRYLTTMIDYFKALSLKTQVLLFPEGTNLTEVTLARSRSFAEKNNLPALQYVLHPRVTGFTFITQHMRNNDQISAVYDITVAYPHNFPVTEPELLGGNFPKEVHFHVKRYAISELPTSEEGLQEWCRERWMEKEERLAHFYKHKSFTSTAHLAVGDNNNTTNATDTSSTSTSSSSSVRYVLLATLALWTSFVLLSFVLLHVSSVARWLALAHSLFFMYMGHRGGFELYQAQCCLRQLRGAGDEAVAAERRKDE